MKNLVEEYLCANPSHCAKCGEEIIIKFKWSPDLLPGKWAYIVCPKGEKLPEIEAKDHLDEVVLADISSEKIIEKIAKLREQKKIF